MNEWGIYPFPPAFWRHPDVKDISPSLAYFGPLPQHAGGLLRIVGHLEPAYVYVIQDREGDVPYIGKTVNPVGRLTQHRYKKSWWPTDGALTLLSVWGATRREADRNALRVESLAIQYVEPTKNIAGVVR